MQLKHMIRAAIIIENTEKKIKIFFKNKNV